jgi:2',3'-cyclic-nucleotide 2'-phosphodiesterase (5'-nucleotidase family)
MMMTTTILFCFFFLFPILTVGLTMARIIASRRMQYLLAAVLLLLPEHVLGMSFTSGRLLLAASSSLLFLPGTSHASLYPPHHTRHHVNLPFGDVNILVVTDVHSWIAGHARHEVNTDADYGDILSFYQHLKRHADIMKKDLFFVMNGDFMDGTGLSTVPPIHLTPLLEQMPWDVVNLGNHELYHNATVEWIVKDFVPHWQGKVLTSNSLLESTLAPIGNRYTYLHGSYSNSTILTFGFLFDFTANCATAIVEQVEEVVRQEWFVHVLQKGNFDAILVMAHMHVTDPLITVLRTAMRAIVGHDMPIQFITGHSHIRGYELLDDNSVSFEAGRFLDTVGFCSFPLLKTKEKAKRASGDTATRFPHVFLDTNRKSLAKVLGISSFDLPTVSGISLTDKIHQTQDSLGLLQPVGCSPREYYLASGMESEQSLWGLYIKSVVPTMLTHHNESLVFVQATGAFRYDLFPGTMVLDDVIAVCPFNDTIYKIAQDILGSELLEILRVATTQPNSALQTGSPLPYFAVSTETINPDDLYDLTTVHFHVNYLVERTKKITGSSLSPPQAVLNNSTGEIWTSTELWTEFVQQEWPCTTQSSSDHGGSSEDIALASKDSGKAEKPKTAAVFIILIVCGLWVYQKRKKYLQRQGYMPMVQTSILHSFRGTI